MDNFREWLSDNLRYIMLGAAILVILTGLFFGVRACTGNMKGDSGVQVIDEDAEDNKGTNPSSPTNNGETDEKKENANPMEKNAYPEVNALIQNYYTALGAKDVDTLKTLVDVLEPSDESKIVNAKDYIESYQVGDIYTKKGLTEDSYVVYVCFDYICSGISTPVPALSQIYVKTESDGTLKIYANAEADSKVREYTEQLQSDEEVTQLREKVEAEYENAQKQDPALAEFLNGLGEDAGTSAEGTVRTVKEACNVRAQANGDSEIIGGLDEGTQVTQTGSEGEWIKIDYEGETGYVYADLLQ